MGELINGRTPEEIKRVLTWANYNCGGFDCDDCPYQDVCSHENERRVVSDALALIQHLEAQQLKWISVKEQSPKENTYYMVSVNLYGNRGMYTDIAMFDGELWVRDAGSYFDILDKGDITHFMPLPEPPGGGQRRRELREVP